MYLLPPRAKNTYYLINNIQDKCCNVDGDIIITATLILPTYLFIIDHFASYMYSTYLGRYYMILLHIYYAKVRNPSQILEYPFFLSGSGRERPARAERELTLSHRHSLVHT